MLSNLCTRPAVSLLARVVLSVAMFLGTTAAIKLVFLPTPLAHANRH